MVERGKRGLNLGLLLRLWVGGEAEADPRRKADDREGALHWERKRNWYMLCSTQGNSLSSIWSFAWPLVLSWGLAIHVP